ncbi:hypothetical protein BO71DRAFT_488816 [Aspergillus ellipticus CBS 707.79]|uniref:Uncharacterized protein n=1 Tax=Aspergillus ellipticus CBS 707.79 TaxID=1448320 RepID=A0A319CSW7_9EURO|nr:hypothetical protein BO71DRAFT_488816 [Aspergillus ellipticus CBS 707.79]
MLTFSCNVLSSKTASCLQQRSPFIPFILRLSVSTTTYTDNTENNGTDLSLNYPPDHERRPTAAIVMHICPVCWWPPSETNTRRKELLLTCDTISYILDIPARDPEFVHAMVRFYARGDFRRWGQPQASGAIFPPNDTYITEMAIESIMNTVGHRQFYMNPGYSFDVALADIWRSDPLNYLTLNWGGQNFMPKNECIYASFPLLQQSLVVNEATTPESSRKRKALHDVEQTPQQQASSQPVQQQQQQQQQQPVYETASYQQTTTTMQLHTQTQAQLQTFEPFAQADTEENPRMPMARPFVLVDRSIAQQNPFQSNDAPNPQAANENTPTSDDPMDSWLRPLPETGESSADFHPIADPHSIYYTPTPLANYRRSGVARRGKLPVPDDAGCVDNDRTIPFTDPVTHFAHLPTPAPTTLYPATTSTRQLSASPVITPDRDSSVPPLVSVEDLRTPRFTHRFQSAYNANIDPDRTLPYTPMNPEPWDSSTTDSS